MWHEEPAVYEKLFETTLSILLAPYKGDKEYVEQEARRTSTTKRRNKNMTYANMKKYMSVFQNANQLLAQFEVVKRQSKLEKSPYQFVLSWFVEQFPDHQELPNFSDNTTNVINLETSMKGHIAKVVGE